MRRLILFLSMVLPWFLKRILLVRLFGYRLPASAKIGLSYVDVKSLRLAENATIGNFNVFKRLDTLELGESSSIGNFNLVTCIPSDNTQHFKHIEGRHTSLIVGKHSAITMRHLIDCNETVTIGDFTTLAGYSSQLLSHSINLYDCRQDAHPITIGSYCFIGTGCVLLGGCNLPDRSVLGAASLLRSAFVETDSLYAGTPATLKKKLPPETKYYHRRSGWVA